MQHEKKAGFGGVIKGLVGIPLVYVLAALPQGAVVTLARALAALLWKANGRLRKVTECNLGISMPDLAEHDRIELARKSLYELSLNILQIGATVVWAPERLRALVTRVVGKEVLEAAVAHGTGTVIILPHLGNWELVNMLLTKDYSLSAMFKNPKSELFDNFVRKARERTGMKMVPADLSGVRALLKSLHSNQMVIVLPDQVPQKSLGSFAPFFGEMTLTMNLVTNLIQRTDAKAVCCYCKRLPDGNYEFRTVPADEDIYSSDTETALAGLNRSIERCVLDCPEQYQWHYKRYKYLPDFQKRDYGDKKVDA
ncbi:MAG: lysophospholipid acyltransferase family protein [Gammaproteobacteria bacterium]|nr:lysophospholipid acyltransferase family protein [Gammaproteobacteria bacterium]MDH5304679.1 lysophospholipid acyltransferase family protein [Gammaproteobacteria bacterium]MDH5323178.1 lysophospholipid acyltransferase family protein [Gammaproteobacteria bacterium]